MNRQGAAHRVNLPRRASIVVLLAAMILGCSRVQAQDRVTLPDHVLPILDGAQAAPRRANAAQQPMTLTVLLKRTDPAGFEHFLQAVQDPGSPQFRQFLTARELSDRFGPSQASYDAVRSHFLGQGFTVAEDSSSRLALTLRGTRAQAERALAVTIGDYVIGTRHFYANKQNPALPSDVASKIAAITGLSDLGTPRREPVSIEQFYAACAAMLVGAAALTIWICWTWIILGAVGFFTGLALIVLGLCLLGAVLGSDTLPRSSAPTFMNHPYNPPIVRQVERRPSLVPERSRSPRRAFVRGGERPDGTGQSIGLVQFDTFVTSDVVDFLELIGAPSDQIDKLSRVSVNGGVATPGAGESEVLLDIDVTMNMAPGANIIVYSAPSGTSWQTVFNRMVSDNVTVISNSWTSCENEHTLADVQSIDSILQTAAAAGISVFNASGDTGSSCLGGSANTAGVPATSPHATAVGGTSMKSAPGFAYLSETWWQNQGGFGVSQHFSRPTYQNGLSSAPMRSVPDLSVTADPVNGIIICQASAGGCPTGSIFGGTSMSAPLMAAYAAILNDSHGQNLGDFNQAVYPFASQGAFHTPASMGSDFAHVGLGSPNLGTLDRLLNGHGVTVPNADQSQIFVSSALINEFEVPLVMPIPADGIAAGTVSVILRDVHGHTVGGKSVTLSDTGTSDVMITPANGAVSSDSNGTVVFKVSNLTAETVTFKAVDTTDGFEVSGLASVTFGVPPATSAGIAAFPTTVPANAANTSTITITLKDSLNRPTPGKRISISQGNGHSVIAGPADPVTDASGQILFTVSNATTETVTYTAVDETDRQPIPGSAIVEFNGSGNSCATTPVAADGYALTQFASGFKTGDFFYSGVNWGGCPGAQNPSFGPDGSVFVSEFTTGNLSRLDASGGTAFSGNLLANHGPTLNQPLFAPDGNLYVARGATGSGSGSGAILQLDPTTGAAIRTVASNVSCPTIAIDPLSGDIFVSHTCFGGGTDDARIQRIQDPNSATPIITDYANFPTTPGGSLSFAPDGTLFGAYAYTAGPTGRGLVQISGTDKRSPATVTPMPDVHPLYWVRVAEVDQSGAAKSLFILTDDGAQHGEMQLVDLTENPLAFTNVIHGYPSTGVTGPDGCLYVTAGNAIFKVGPSSGECGFAPSSPAPSLSLSSSAGRSDPALGTSQTLTAAFHNITPPSGSAVLFKVSGANAQIKLGRTNAQGVATVQYTGHIPGTDNITAIWVSDPSQNQATLTSNVVRIAWAAPQVGAWGEAALKVLMFLVALIVAPVTRRSRVSE